MGGGVILESLASVGDARIASLTGSLYLGAVAGAPGLAASPGAARFQSGGALQLEASDDIAVSRDLTVVGALEIDTRSSVSLAGQLSGLASVSIRSDGDVHLLGSVQNVSGFTVVTPSLSDQATRLRQLEANLRQQVALQEAIAASARSLSGLAAGGDALVDQANDSALQQLVRLPVELQQAQARAQLTNVNALYTQQLSLPKTLSDFPEYATLLADRTSALGQIASLNVDLAQSQQRLDAIVGNTAGFEQQLTTVRGDLVAATGRQTGLDGLVSRIDQVIASRPGYNGVASGEPGPAAGVLPTDQTLGALSALSNDALATLRAQAASESGQLGGGIVTLRASETHLVGQIAANEGTLGPVSRSIAAEQTTVATLQPQIASVQGLIAARTLELDGVNGQ
ncbi:MAG: hypothetical protein ACOYLX_23445, partial [Burkholderiaceae bacterium]